MRFNAGNKLQFSIIRKGSNQRSNPEETKEAMAPACSVCISYQIAEIEDSTDRTEVGLDMKNYRRGNFRGNVRNFNRQNCRGEYRSNYRNKGYDRSRNRSQKGHFPEAITTTEVGVQAIVDPGQDQEQV